MNGTGLGKDIILYFKVFGLYPEFGNSFPATASGKIDFGNSVVIWYDGNELDATYKFSSISL